MPLPVALGVAVHDVATWCVREVRAGRALPSLSVARERAAAALNDRRRGPRRQLPQFWRRPKQVPVFLEALYGTGPTAAALTRARAKLDRMLAALLNEDSGGYEVWNWVSSAAPGDVIVPDPFARFALGGDPALPAGLPDGVPVYAAADLLVRPGPEAPWHVVEIKTGGADGVVDQVLTCGLAAEHALGLDLTAPGGRGVVVALDAPPADRLTTFAITREDLVEAERRVRQGDRRQPRPASRPRGARAARGRRGERPARSARVPRLPLPGALSLRPVPADARGAGPSGDPGCPGLEQIAADSSELGTIPG